MGRGHWTHSPTPNTVKMVVLLSLKTNWRLEKFWGIFSSLTSKAQSRKSLLQPRLSRKIHKESSRGGEMIMLGPTPLVGDTKREGDVISWGATSYRVRDFSPHVCFFNPGIWHWEDESPHLVWKSVGFIIGAMRNWDFIMKSMHTHFLTPRNITKKAY